MTWIQTYTGKVFNLAAPRPEDVDLEDIAHALSQICRYTGHSKWHYSVAQHCVLACRMAPNGLQLQALLHDAGEAYTNDISRPMKRTEIREPLAAVEHRVWIAIAKAFALPFKISHVVKKIDLRLLATEAKQLLGPPPTPWKLGVEPYSLKIGEWSPAEAKRRFLEEFEQHKGEMDLRWKPNTSSSDLASTNLEEP